MQARRWRWPFSLWSQHTINRCYSYLQYQQALSAPEDDCEPGSQGTNWQQTGHPPHWWDQLFAGLKLKVIVQYYSDWLGNIWLKPIARAYQGPEVQIKGVVLLHLAIISHSLAWLQLDIITQNTPKFCGKGRDAIALKKRGAWYNTWKLS